MNTSTGKTMTSTNPRLWLAKVAALTAFGTAIVFGQTPAATQAPKPQTPATQTAPAPPTQTPIFRTATDVFRIDVYPRDSKGQFVPTLGVDDFKIFEDGVEQKIINFT